MVRNERISLAEGCRCSVAVTELLLHALQTETSRYRTSAKAAIFQSCWAVEGATSTNSTFALLCLRPPRLAGQG